MFERKLVDDKSRITALTFLEAQLSCQGTFDLPVLLFILPLTLQSEPFFRIFLALEWLLREHTLKIAQDDS